MERMIATVTEVSGGRGEEGERRERERQMEMEDAGGEVERRDITALVQTTS